MVRRFDPYARINQLIIDAAIFTFSFAAAYLIRFEGLPAWPSAKQFLLWLPYLVAARLLINWKLGIYQFIWRYVSLPDALAIARSLSLVTAGLLGLRLFYPPGMIFGARLRVPLSVIAFEYLLSLSGSLGARALRRILYERGQKIALTPFREVKRLILYGAGRAGILLLKELKNHGDVEVVGFVDDDPKKIGTVISGTRVLGDRKALGKLVRVSSVDEVVISIAKADRRTLSQILARCEEINVPAKIIPSVQELFQERVNISQVRQVRIENLLGRDSDEVSEFDEDVRRAYAGKRILVTGAGGSIGSELVRQLLLLNPSSIAILDKDENSTYELQQELVFRFPEARIEPQIADVRHAARLHAIFQEFKPQIVFHAAAHKHVPLMEKHPCEAVLNNVFGTQTLLEACRQHEVERFVFISTDKAVNPTSVMGATKGVGEMLVQAYANHGALPTACVRFGNVMGSRGSVIPLFQKQIAEGGPITVTHPDVVRFFMTIPEAVQLVICAGSLGRQGEIFVMDMGNPRKVLDLAKEMVSLVGLEPGKDIEIEITGLRPGEKLEEELVRPDERVAPTRFEKLSMITPQLPDVNQVTAGVSKLVQAARENNREAVYGILASMGIGYQPHSDEANGPVAPNSSHPEVG
jgi:FlaA1/EpsC-like NDP-sugar epimerase